MSSAIVGQNFPRLLKIATEYPVGFFLSSIFQTTYKIDKGKDIYKSREKKNYLSAIEDMSCRFFQNTNVAPDPLFWFSNKECFSSKEQQFVFFIYGHTL